MADVTYRIGNRDFTFTRHENGRDFVLATDSRDTTTNKVIFDLILRELMQFRIQIVGESFDSRMIDIGTAMPDEIRSKLSELEQKHRDDSPQVTLTDSKLRIIPGDLGKSSAVSPGKQRLALAKTIVRPYCDAVVNCLSTSFNDEPITILQTEQVHALEKKLTDAVINDPQIFTRSFQALGQGDRLLHISELFKKLAGEFMDELGIRDEQKNIKSYYIENKIMKIAVAQTSQQSRGRL